MNIFDLFVGMRYLRSRKRHQGLNVTTWISIGGIAVGVMSLIVVISVMNGFGNDLRNKLLKFKSHLLIESKTLESFPFHATLAQDIQKTNPKIKAIQPYLSTEMMLKAEDAVTGILYKGVTDALLSGAEMTQPNMPSVLLGKELGHLMGLVIGDEVTIISPIETVGPLGSLPKMKKYQVSGWIQTGVYEIDTKLVYVSLVEAQDFLERQNHIDGYEIMLHDAGRVEEVVSNLKKFSFPFEVSIRGWPELNRALFSALKLEKFAMFLILSFIVLVAALNIITTITRVVLEKRKEISILKIMGAKQKNIMMIFLFQGIWMGLLGVGFGVTVGVLICFILNRFEILKLPDIYYSTSVPIEMQAWMIVLIACVAILITLLSSLYPAWKASKLNFL